MIELLVVQGEVARSIGHHAPSLGRAAGRAEVGLPAQAEFALAALREVSAACAYPRSRNFMQCSCIVWSLDVIPRCRLASGASVPQSYSVSRIRTSENPSPAGGGRDCISCRHPRRWSLACKSLTSSSVSRNRCAGDGLVGDPTRAEPALLARRVSANAPALQNQGVRSAPGA